MSSWALLPLLLAAQPVNDGPPVTAEQAMQTYRETFNAVPTRRCTAPERPDELVVCARRPEEDRLPLPVEPEPGAPIRMVPGESPRATVPNCVYVCHDVGVGLNLGQVIKAVEGIKRALED
jgi:hypothetical protein